MGAYLSQPKTDKVSTDERNDYVAVGASSMQGWRNSQEDAHNAILDFDELSSFFAVYDGHGGAEVATYCADKLPQFLKGLAAYKDGNFELALKDAFLGFDKTLLDPQVVDILKILAGEKNIGDAESDGQDGEEDDEDLAELHEESNLPLDEVLEKYKGGPSMPTLKRIKDEKHDSKPQSPYLRGRRAAAVAADAANKAVMDPDAKPEGSSTSAAAAAAFAAGKDAGPSSSRFAEVAKMDTEEPEEDSTVSSSSSGASKTNSNNAIATADVIEAEATAAAASNEKPKAVKTNGAAKDAAPTSSSITAEKADVKSFSSPDSSQIKETDQNGSVTSSEAKVLKACVSTSSPSPLPNAAAAATVAKRAADEDSAVSGSNDTNKSKQNGSVANCASSSSVVAKTHIEAVGSAISSTSKGGKKNLVTGDDDSTDDDADYDIENSSTDENDPNHSHDSSEDDMEEDEDEEDEDDDDAEKDDDDDDDEENEDMIANEQFCASMIEEPGKDSGCTAVVAFLNGRDLYVANAGDSRCVVCRSGKAIDMSLDHKPEDDEESERIIKAGGRVTLDGRVNGGLNLSRAIGDHAYKMNGDLKPDEQMISALPDVKKLIITDEDEFMVLACDGIWNYMSSEEVVEFVALRLKNKNKKVSEICEELFDNCLAPNTMGDGTGCDNMTAVIIRFQPKLLELPTKINANHTEDLLAAKRTAEADAADASLQKSLKRCASPTTRDDINSNEAENANKTKRLKTDDEEETTSSTTINNTPSKSNGSSAAATSSTTTTIAEQKECDSVSTAEVSSISST